MKLFLGLFLSVAVLSTNALAGLVDGFDGDLSVYTSTVILDANGGGSNTSEWQISQGELQLSTTVFDGIEQYALIRNGLSLAIGEELQADISIFGGSQDIGLYVGGTAPVTGVRSTYVSVYARNNGQIFSRGFNGTAELALAGGVTPAFDRLFVSRTAENDFELGFYDGNVRNVITSRLGMTGNDASFVGFYADVRAVGLVGNADNFSVVPEPSSLVIAGCGALLVGFRRRR